MKAWEEFVRIHETKLGQGPAKKWLRLLKVVKFDARNIYLEASDPFQAIWFEEHILPIATSSLFNENQQKIKVHLTVNNASELPKKKVRKRGTSEKVEPGKPVFNLVLDGLDPHCTFDTYIAVETNAFPLKFLIDLTTKSDANQSNLEMMNPVYLYGATGSGKTHLLMAAAAALRSQGKRVAYARADTFADHVVAAIRAGEMSAFRDAYRNNDALVIDDVHIFSRKGATQEEFFHTFNTLQMAGRQIILGSNMPPKELQAIEPRLISRFEWGIVLHLDKPTKVDMQKILAIKIENHAFPLHKRVQEYLLDTFGSATSLNKAVEALLLRFHMKSAKEKYTSTQLSIAQIEQLLSDLIEEETQHKVTPERIIQETAEHFGIMPQDITGSNQAKECALPRQIAMYLCRTELKIPYIPIGQVFSRDHSTVMSSVKLIQKGIDSDEGQVGIACRTILRKLSEAEKK